MVFWRCEISCDADLKTEGVNPSARCLLDQSSQIVIDRLREIIDQCLNREIGVIGGRDEIGREIIIELFADGKIGFRIKANFTGLQALSTPLPRAFDKLKSPWPVKRTNERCDGI